MGTRPCRRSIPRGFSRALRYAVPLPAWPRRRSAPSSFRRLPRGLRRRGLLRQAGGDRQNFRYDFLDLLGAAAVEAVEILPKRAGGLVEHVGEHLPRNVVAREHSEGDHVVVFRLRHKLRKPLVGKLRHPASQYSERDGVVPPIDEGVGDAHRQVFSLGYRQVMALPPAVRDIDQVAFLKARAFRKNRSRNPDRLVHGEQSREPRRAIWLLRKPLRKGGTACRIDLTAEPAENIVE